jgi:hypothetical protein
MFRFTVFVIASAVVVVGVTAIWRILKEEAMFDIFRKNSAVAEAPVEAPPLSPLQKAELRVKETRAALDSARLRLKLAQDACAAASVESQNALIEFSRLKQSW